MAVVPNPKLLPAVVVVAVDPNPIEPVPEVVVVFVPKLNAVAALLLVFVPKPPKLNDDEPKIKVNTLELPRYINDVHSCPSSLETDIF